MRIINQMKNGISIGRMSQSADAGKPLDSEEESLVAVPRIERGTRGL